MSIYVVEGIPGAGKTTFVCKLILEWLEYFKRTQNEERQILANVPIYLPGVELLDNWQDIRRLSKRSIVVIDEAPAWFSCHNSKENQQFLDFFTQHRKDGNTIYLIAQHSDMLDVSIRSRTCQGIWRIKRLFGPNRWEQPSGIEKAFGWWALARLYDAHDYGKATKQVHQQSRLFRIDALHGKFDTLARVGSISEVGIKRGAGLAGAVTGAQAEGAPGHPPLPKVIKSAEEYDRFRKSALFGGLSGVVSLEVPVDRDMYDRVTLALEEVA